MSHVKKGLLILSLLISPLGSASAEEAKPEAQPLSEAKNVYLMLLENHISKPTEKQLIQGALKRIKEEALETSKTQLTYTSADDTLTEWESRVEQWQKDRQLSWESVNDWSIEGMIDSLNDPHTMFFTRDQLQRFQESVNNQFVGFGLRFFTHDGHLIVREIMPSTPAAEADIKPGDILYAVNGENISGNNLEKAVELMRGNEGTQAELTIYKPKTRQMKKITLTRAEISIPEVTGGRFAGDVAYLKIDTFGENTGIEFRDELQKLMNSQNKPKGLVLDLRDNGGGYLTAAKDVASFFLEDGLLNYTTDRNGIELQTWVHNGDPVNLPVRILVNENTASASELLSGALVDHNIAKLVGKRTYGKGSAQQVIPLENGDALKITLNEYFTPNHRVVNKVGLAPDIAEEDDLAQVIRALDSLGVKRFDIRESNLGSITVNGIEQFSGTAVFKATPKGYEVRANILAALLHQPAPKQNSYVRLPLSGKRGPVITFQKNKDEIVLKSLEK